MNPHLLWNVKYWSDKLNETREDAAPVLSKIHFHSGPQNLTWEDYWNIRNALEAYASYSKLLAEDIGQYETKTEVKKPFWKKLFRK